MAKMKHQIAAGVDLGGTTFAVGLLTRDGDLVAHEQYDTPRSDTEPLALEAIVAAILGIMESATVKPDELAAVGVGIPGPVDPEAGTIKQCPNMHELDGVNVSELVGDGVGVPTFIANDAYCATLAELRYGAGRDVDRLVMFTLGTGVGGGIALGNAVERGPRQIMGEVGHIIVDPDGPSCGCGSYGCLEAIVGRDGIVGRATELMAQGRASSLAETSGEGHMLLTPKMVSEAARAGDSVACEVIEATGYYVGIALCDCIVLCDPDLVVIGGGIAAAGDLLFEPMRKTVRRRSTISGFDTTKIVAAELGSEAGMYGAAALVWEGFEG